MAAARIDIDESLVSHLIGTQFPEWVDLPIRPVESTGWDNRTFRLGEDMVVRLPSAEAYAAQIKKEQKWLPRLGPHLPLPIPVPLAMGLPTDDFPWHWSVYQWIKGERATTERIPDLSRFAATLAEFLRTLEQIDPAGGPPPGSHNFFRGGPLAIYDTETRSAVSALSGSIDTREIIAVWEAALNASWDGTPVWVHGDMSPQNLLVENGRLGAVIDFGCLGIGDPACDLIIAWTLFSEQSRETFRAALQLDPATWSRGRGWAMWKALITLAANADSRDQKARLVIEEVLGDHRSAS